MSTKGWREKGENKEGDVVEMVLFQAVELQLTRHNNQTFQLCLPAVWSDVPAVKTKVNSYASRERYLTRRYASLQRPDLDC
jgi:hypothetical protein